MRYDSDHKQQTRKRVLDAAANALRKDGPDRVGVAGVMAKAGLTHGGFYAHFASKDELVTATIAHMLEQSRERLLLLTAGAGPAEGIAAYIDFYLSRRHRDSKTSGCPMAALTSDIPRLGKGAREMYSEGARHLAEALAARLSELGRPDAQAEARSAVSELIGALAMARVETDAQRSDAILDTSRDLLKRRLGVGATV